MNGDGTAQPAPDVSARPVRALLVRNPVARRRIDDETLAAVMEVAAAAGWRIDMINTDRAGHATEIARDAAARGVHVLVVHGGDGTINEAVNGIANTDTALAVLRGGTANIWAKETQCDKDPVKSMRAIVTGVRRYVDLGRANERHFLLMAGVGLDATIVQRVSPRLKRWIGAAAYVITGVVTVIRTRAWRADVQIDGDRSERSLYWLILGNTRLYGGVAHITHKAVADDAQLDLALVRRGGPRRLLADMARLALKRHDRSPNVRFHRTTSVHIATPGIPVQIDGEAHGATPMLFEVAPLALAVIVPRTLRSPLFTRPPG